ncbi:DUF937 domain-containing protein [Rhizobiaceae bacterium n13]|uniref:DUF937 domain-containing protein n=1 Tax=Ferirhizobium litorale TaxID=2927786 RepID=A0AAE3U062_9HYPH|nr:DUF937 domain-containing protein [Fererhizobium litorale]MDI7864817.1 DUF937 domain-containing protein [Fererhizobium litorale]MDI7921729.1 DUF937 domain-containing protein [Fererhizobium litorale]
MLPLFDMMMRAQNGAGIDAMAKQFNLAQDQVTKAMAALMPAFSSGLKRNSANPYDFTALMQAVSSGNYAKYFEDMSKAFTPQGMADGNTMLGQIFGSKEVSRGIAAQAAQMTGIGQEILKQMMPVMANTLMGGLFKQGMGQIQDYPNPFMNGPMGDMMRQWMESTGFAPKKPEPSIFDNPFTQAMQAMFAGQKATPSPSEADPFAINAFTKMFQDMMGGNFETTPAPAKAPSAEKPEAQKQPASADLSAYNDMIASLFDSGLEVQKNYQKSIESIFDNYMKHGANGAATAGPEKPAP